MDKDLFEKEETILRAAEESVARTREQCPPEFIELLEAYRKLFNQLKRIVRFSDAQQRELSNVNATLKIASQELAHYLPAQVYDMVFSGAGHVKIESDRKKLTVFFSDIVQFTDKTEHLDHEQLVQLLNYYLSQMFAITKKYGGTIDKVIGDAIMAFFGGETSEADSALKCVKMAIEMRDRLEHIHKAAVALGISEPFQVRMGIATGYCTIGNFGSEERMTYTIIGPTVNHANRMETHASANQILIEHQTYTLVKEEVSCRYKGLQYFKGVGFPLRTYEVIDLFENLHTDKEVLQEGFAHSFYVNLTKLSKEEQATLISFIEEILPLLQRENPKP